MIRYNGQVTFFRNRTCICFFIGSRYHTSMQGMIEERAKGGCSEVMHGGSDRCIVIFLFGMHSFAMPIIFAVTYFAYMSISSSQREFQSNEDAHN